MSGSRSSDGWIVTIEVTVDDDQVTEWQEASEGQSDQFSDEFEKQFTPNFSVSWFDRGMRVTASVADQDHLHALTRTCERFTKAARNIGFPDLQVHSLGVLSPAAAQQGLSQGLRPLELMGVAELSQALGVSKQRVSELRKRPPKYFPKPDAEVKASPLWRKSSIDAFLARWDRAPGRRAEKRSEREEALGTFIKDDGKQIKDQLDELNKHLDNIAGR